MAKPISFEEWMKSARYLPPFMRDFHDQKQIFKRLDEMVNGRQDLPNWIMAHIYVVDFFLWFMARRGWTLQPSRMGYPFINMEADLAAFRARELKQINLDFQRADETPAATP